jgi:hypothetical protein
MWEKYFGIFVILNIYIFKEILLNFLKNQNFKLHKKIPNYFFHVLVVMFQWCAKFQIHTFYLLRDIKKRK